VSKKEILDMLSNLIGQSGHYQPADNDPSGCFGTYIIDQERLLKLIDIEIKGLKVEDTDA
jgi:hypothetical protein